MAPTHTLASPLGLITLDATDTALTSVTIADSGTPDQQSPEHPVLARAAAQLDEYFLGTRREFDLALDLAGTAFQRAVWAALSVIPYGTSMSYGELGHAAGVGFAPRAVGGAVGANPVPIIIPCHRVLAADRRITGYSGGAGIATKQQLLELEGISYR